jgi:GxxExxY protein
VKVNEITEAVIGAAIEVHRALGPGLLESAYIQCLCYELTLRKIPFGWRCLYRSFTKDSNSIVDIASTWLWPVP